MNIAVTSILIISDSVEEFLDPGEEPNSPDSLFSDEDSDKE